MAALVFLAAAVVLTALSFFSYWRVRVWERRGEPHDPYFTVTDGHANQWASPASISAQWFFPALNSAFGAVVCWITAAVLGLIWLLN